jgi:hypothetical protein
VDDERLYPVRAWLGWRERLHAVDPGYDVPSDPAFHQIDRWGRLGGAMGPDAVTRAVKRIAARGGVEATWTRPAYASTRFRGTSQSYRIMTIILCPADGPSGPAAV